MASCAGGLKINHEKHEKHEINDFLINEFLRETLFCRFYFVFLVFFVVKKRATGLKWDKNVGWVERSE
ncbi:hypothetical protein WDW89_12640, partial [Deltaproteobacteria bacterium TL4]